MLSSSALQRAISAASSLSFLTGFRQNRANARTWRNCAATALFVLAQGLQPDTHEDPVERRPRSG
jgi:hypothetical protein